METIFWWQPDPCGINGMIEGVSEQILQAQCVEIDLDMV